MKYLKIIYFESNTIPPSSHGLQREWKRRAGCIFLKIKIQEIYFPSDGVLLFARVRLTNH